MSDEPDSEDIILVDTNVFVAVGEPENAKYQSLREYAQQRNLVMLVPQRVRDELSTMHIANRVETAVDNGWAEIVDPPSPTHADAVTAMDTVRGEIARRSDKDEHEVEKADTVLAGLAIEYRQRRDENVFVLTDDRVAAEAIRVAVQQQDDQSAVTVVTRTEILDSDDDLRLI